jgi:hypothetical protein
MDTTRFPIDTDNPNFDVILPVGTHVLKLTVFDNAGLASRADTVVITVKPERKPEIINIVPTVGLQGTTVSAVIYGKNLDQVTAVAIYRGAQQDERITVSLRSGGTPEQLPILLTIHPHAEPGPRLIEVTAPTGIDTVGFDVLPRTAPAPKQIEPGRGQVGNSQPYAMKIRGEHLDQAEEVAFLLRDRPDDQLRAQVQDSTDATVSLNLKISANAEFGQRRFAVTTASGTGRSPVEATFRVVPGNLQIAIIVMTLAAVLVHLLLPFPPAAFLVVSLGYLLLLAGLYLPLPELATARPWLRWLMALYVVGNVIVWLLLAPKGALVDFLLPVIEVTLAVLLFVETQSPQWREGVVSGE